MRMGDFELTIATVPRLAVAGWAPVARTTPKLYTAPDRSMIPTCKNPVTAWLPSCVNR